MADAAIHDVHGHDSHGHDSHGGGAGHAAPQHDYHLVNPSPWPLMGSASAVVRL